MPWSNMNSVPQALKTAGLTLPQANVWAKYYDQGKAAGAKAPGGLAWHRFKQEYTEVSPKQWKAKVQKEEIEIPYVLKDEVILKEGDANEVFYSADVIKASIPYLMEVVSEDDDPEERHKNSIFLDHDDGTETWVGDFRNPRWDDGEKLLRADIYIVDESIAKKIDYQRKAGVMRFSISPRLECKMNEENKKATEIKFKGISLVIFPAGGSKLVLKEDGNFISTSSFFKRNDEERIVYGIVLEPDSVDSQGDYFDENTIRMAMYKFMEDYRILAVQHQDKYGKTTPVMSDDMGKDWNSYWNLDVLETFSAPVDFKLEGQEIKKGSWVMCVRVNDKAVWNAIKNGKITGFSVGGHAE